jgi:hypothetical protein
MGSVYARPVIALWRAGKPESTGKLELCLVRSNLKRGLLNSILIPSIRLLPRKEAVQSLASRFPGVARPAVQDRSRTGAPPQTTIVCSLTSTYVRISADYAKEIVIV